MSTDKKLNLNAEELKEFLEYTIENNKFLITKNIVPLSINIEGTAGVGKTSSVIALMDEKGIPIIRKNLAELDDLSDLVGYPYKEHEIINGASEIEWVSEKLLPQKMALGYKVTGEKRMGHAAPEWIHGHESPVCLLLDDYTRASERFIQACMTLIETQRYNNWELPKGSLIVLTTNPDNGNYSVASMDNAQKTRMININFKFDIEVWAAWAEKKKIDSRCINFLMLNPELVTEDVNARSITMFFNSISSIPDFEKKLSLIQLLGEGCVGPEFATMFTIFIKNKLDKLISPKDILFHENENYIFNELRGCLDTKGDYRSDIASTLVHRIINYGLVHAEDHAVDQKMIDRLIRLSTEPQVFTDDLKYVIVKKMLNGNKTKFGKIMTHPEVLKMSAK